MAGTKRKVGQEDIIPKPKLLLIINSIDNLRDRALICFIYMSGCRISEILGTKKTIKNYIKEKGKFILDEKGYRKFTDTYSLSIPALTKESIEFIPDKEIMLINDVPCLKRRSEVPKRYIPIFIPLVKEFFDIFMQYFNTLKQGDPLFHITRQRAWQILNEKTGMFNHFLIHNRVTHLVVQQGFSDQELKIFRGWSSTMPANSYVHMRWQSIAKKQGANIEDS